MNRFEKWSLMLSVFLAGASGIGLLWTKYLVHSDDPWAVINHPLQPWFLKTHIVVTPLLVFALGLVTARHIWPYLRAARWGKSGVGIAVLAVPLVVTGYLIQTVIEQRWLGVLAVAHIVLGFLFMTGFVVHQARAYGRGEREGSGGRRRSNEPRRAGLGAVASTVTAEVEIGVAKRKDRQGAAKKIAVNDSYCPSTHRDPLGRS
jgi:hypothetical protein